MVPPAMAASGSSVEVQQPKSHITITAVTDQLNHAFGDTAEIHATLMNDNRPIVGGTVDGIVELPGRAGGEVDDVGIREAADRARTDGEGGCEPALRLFIDGDDARRQ